MDLATIPWAQGSLVGITLAVIFATVGLVLKGVLVHRSVVDDVRADRDARIAEANEDAEEWRRLWEAEREAHEVTRRAHDEERRAELRAAAEGTQLAAALLQTIQTRQIEAGHDT
ncbi:hypothetical protein DQ384_05515 [Sphaerisporangium album]|uniref:Uncharacterized protein n=1 Tax=Sphaerisporangium album TaxID=509200 RepID=A0A367FP05_9ACTN|nr:hypothetical protein [Sphaerisporangium album]RCG32001.1 hypothetical protein DQ384_05515 [Sphaerisporangium album]